MKKINNKLISILLLFAGIILIGSGLILIFNGSNSDKEEYNNVSLNEDYYESINGEKISKATIPTDANGWSRFYDAQVMVNTKKKIAEEKILSNPEYSNPNMDIFIELFTDYNTRNQKGISELKPYFDLIDNATTMEEFNDAILKIEYDLGVSAFINVSAEQDINNNTRNVPVYAPAKIEDMYEVYTESKFTKYKEAYIKFRNKILKLYGYTDDKINDINEKIEAFVKKIQEKSKVISDIHEITKLYNYYTLDDIKENFHNLPMLKHLELFKIDNLDSYVFYDFEHYKELDANYTIENLELFKEIEKIRILEEVACPLTTEEFLQAQTDLQNDVMGISYGLDDMKTYILSKLKESLIGDDLYEEYEKAYFTEEDKESVKELINEIKDYYKILIEETDWLEDSTKEEAIKKLDNMKINIGYIPEKENDDIDLVAKKDGGTLISNYILDVKNDSENVYKSFEDGSADTTYKDLEVNAYYRSTENSINFPAAFYELAAGTDDYYEKLGILGTVIGHEISHAFDNNGSQFDENGKVRNWWTESDVQKYEELKKKIIDYYSNYEILGLKVDGEKTLGENIADLAGMKAVMYVAEKHNATDEDYKKIFKAYAELWAEKIEKDNLEKQMVVDTHSPNKIRVNAVLSSTDKFYEVYGIKEGDKMYVAPLDRVGLW